MQMDDISEEDDETPLPGQTDPEKCDRGERIYGNQVTIGIDREFSG